MRIILFFILFILAGCSFHNINTNVSAAKESSQKNENIDEYKKDLEKELLLISKEIMNDEYEISQAPSYKRMLRFIGYIKNHIVDSRKIIKNYREKSSNIDYQIFLDYVDCTYEALNASYMYMEAVIKSEQEEQYIKRLDLFRKKIREDTADVFLNDMKGCEEIYKKHTKF